MRADERDSLEFGFDKREERNLLKGVATVVRDSLRKGFHFGDVYYRHII